MSKILVVDDSYAELQVIEGVLKGANHTVVSFPNTEKLEDKVIGDIVAATIGLDTNVAVGPTDVDLYRFVAPAQVIEPAALERASSSTRSIARWSRSSSSCGGGTSQPNRMPGATDLLAVPR